VVLARLRTARAAPTRYHPLSRAGLWPSLGFLASGGARSIPRFLDGVEFEEPPTIVDETEFEEIFPPENYDVPIIAAIVQGEEAANVYFEPPFHDLTAPGDQEIDESPPDEARREQTPDSVLTSSTPTATASATPIRRVRLRRGDTIEVEGSNSALTYRVQSVDVLSKDDVAHDAEQIFTQTGAEKACCHHL
jgi:hypothetical protein